MVKCWDGDKFDHVMSLPVCVVVCGCVVCVCGCVCVVVMSDSVH